MNQRSALIISLLMDFFGFLSYFIPFFGEFSDLLFAPIQAAWIYFTYGNKVMTGVGFLEELLPFSDFIPSCVIAHYLFYKNEI